MISTRLLNFRPVNPPQTLTLARDYAAEVKKPFPEIDNKVLEDRDWPKDCYVFEGNGTEPTIVYMPLFNQQNCKGLFHSNTQRSCHTVGAWAHYGCLTSYTWSSQHVCTFFFTDAEEFKAKMEEFSTFQRPFSPEKINFVLETAKANVKNNKEILLREIDKAILRRQDKRCVWGGVV